MLGLGKVGLPTAVEFVSLGHTVSGFDLNSTLMDRLRRGEDVLPFEPSMNVSLQRRIHFAETAAEAVTYADVVYVIVPTPEDEIGLSSKFVREALDSIRHWYKGVIIVASTLDPRDADQICNEKRIVYNPPLIRLGLVRSDLSSANFLLIGGTDAVSMLVPKGLWKKQHAVEGSPKTIATAKLAINVSLSMRIAWANEISKICQANEVAQDVVLKAVQLDPRIGRGYMLPGWSPSGPCLPRDLVLWEKLACAPLASTMLQVHASQRDAVIAGVMRQILDYGDHPRVAVLGIMYNPNALDTTHSQGLTIAKECAKRGWPVVVYDPAGGLFELEVQQAVSAELAVKDATVVVIATAWLQFEKINILGKPRINLTNLDIA